MALRDERLRRLEAANAVLSFFAVDTRLSLEQGSIRVHFRRQNQPVVKKWTVRGGQSFYPTWYAQWSHGGTAATALAQLVRWVQHRPVLPLCSWEFWAGARCKLFRESGEEVLTILRRFSYPEHVECVRCGLPIKPQQSLDWWCLDGVSGPAHLDSDCVEARPRRPFGEPPQKEGLASELSPPNVEPG